MSQFLSGAECGPSNALKTVSGRIERDYSLHQVGTTPASRLLWWFPVEMEIIRYSAIADRASTGPTHLNAKRRRTISSGKLIVKRSRNSLPVLIAFLSSLSDPKSVSLSRKSPSNMSPLPHTISPPFTLSSRHNRNTQEPLNLGGPMPSSRHHNRSSNAIRGRKGRVLGRMISVSISIEASLLRRSDRSLPPSSLPLRRGSEINAFIRGINSFRHRHCRKASNPHINLPTLDIWRSSSPSLFSTDTNNPALRQRHSAPPSH